MTNNNNFNLVKNVLKDNKELKFTDIWKTIGISEIDAQVLSNVLIAMFDAGIIAIRLGEFNLYSLA